MAADNKKKYEGGMCDSHIRYLCAVVFVQWGRGESELSVFLRAVSLGPHEVNRKKGLRNGSSLAAAQAYSSASSAYRTARSISAGSE